jgi:hypothetical protein
MAATTFIEIAYQNIKTEIQRFLKDEHNKASVLYSPASPYGQILDVLENLHQLSLLYLKNSIKQYDLSDPNSNNERIIRNAALIAGHIPGRAISSTGNLKLVVKSGIDLQTELPGGRITMNNRNLLKNNTNSLFYSLNLGQDKVTYIINSNSQIFLPIIQGKFRTTTVTGSGNPNQTFQITAKLSEEVENFNVEVLVNGEYWTIYKTLYDLSPNEKACVVRTGFNGGVDIIFGNGSFGMMPTLGANIQITHLITNGQDGNIFRRTVNDWKFVDDILDGYGNPVDVTKVFDVLIFNDINFGANKESIQFTKNILPIVSNNFVLGLPQQYAYQIKKLGVFSHVNAYEDNSVVYIVATPNVTLFKNRNADYFNVSTNAFILDDYEKSKIDKYLRSNGNIQLTRKYRIDSPTLSYYIMNVFIIRYSDSNDDSVKAQIIDAVSNYFLNFNRIDRIPKSDIIKVISQINDIHSVDVQFVSKKNEDYHRNNIINTQNKVASATSSIVPSIAPIDPNYIPNLTLGLDPVLGDIIFDSNEYPIIRGGWYDRNGVFFSTSMDDMSLKSLNIIKRGVVDAKNRSNF